MRNLLLCIFITFLGIQTANALQIYSARDNRSIFSKISAKQLTRIFVQGDRIQSVRGIDGTYELTKDEANGAIFIKPTMSYQNRPFNIFITTELSHTYTLLLNPIDVPAETIELKPTSPTKAIAERWEMNSPYSQTLIDLMKAMEQEDNPEGYAVIELGKVKPRIMTSGLSMQLLIIYRGNHLQGEIWKLKNQGRSPLYITPQQFYQFGARAISVEDETLNCGEETLLYRVMSYG